MSKVTRIGPSERQMPTKDDREACRQLIDQRASEAKFLVRAVRLAQEYADMQGSEDFTATGVIYALEGIDVLLEQVTAEITRLGDIDHMLTNDQP